MSKIKDSRQIAKIVLYDDDKKFLLMKNEIGWDLPGGHIKEGEDIESGLLREVKEETGLTISNLQKVKKYERYTFYKAKILSKNINLSNEHTEYDFFNTKDLKDLKISSRFTKAVEDALENIE